MKVLPVAETRARLLAGLPLSIALSCVALVAAGGWVWSFEEQTRWAEKLGFSTPQLLPLVLDGLALSLAGVAFAAALDGRPAVMARLGTLVAVSSSSASNGTAAWSRTVDSRWAVVTIVVASAVPVFANIAFEVFLGELRRQVQRKRGMPAPVAIPWPRLVRLALAPIQTFKAWKALVLDLTDMAVRDSLTDRSVTDPMDQSTDPRSTTGTAGAGGPETPPAPVAQDPDPIESTHRPPVESPMGSGPEPDPTPAGKPAGSTPTRSAPAVNPTAPIGSGGTAPDRADRADQETDGSGSRSNPIRSVPADWKRPAGADPILISAISYAVGEGWISRPITSTDVRAVCSVGRPRDSEIRDQANAWFEDLDRERAELAAEETTATDGAEETEVAHG